MNVTRHRFYAVSAAVSKTTSVLGRTMPGRSRRRAGLVLAAAAVLMLPACRSSRVEEPAFTSEPAVSSIGVFEPSGGGPLQPTIEAPLEGGPSDLRLSTSQVESLAAATGRVVIAGGNRSAEDWRAFDNAFGRVEAGPAFLAGLQDMHGDALRVPVTLASSFLIIPTQERGVTRVNSNYRNGPGTDYTKLGLLKRGTEVTILGQVGASDWVLITRGSQGTDGIGYMFRPLIVTSQVAPLSSDALLEQGVAVDLVSDPALNRDYTDAQLEQILAGGTARRPLLCRDLRHTLTNGDGRQFSWTSTACRMKPLRWKIISAPVEGRV